MGPGYLGRQSLRCEVIRIPMHARHAVAEEHKLHVIKVSHTNVLVIAVNVFSVLNSIAWPGLHLDNEQILGGFQYIMSAILLGQRSNKIYISSTLSLAVMLCQRFVQKEKKVCMANMECKP